ncbi:MAG: hypothetical protein JWN98_539 [Abditibacteriota bacterium]|nr:hypothetical protein [Abditibacteriota bacterium]
MRPARAWRHEPDQLASTVAHRLLGWMEAARLDVNGDIEQIGLAVTQGLAQLMGAREAVLLARQWPQDDMWPLCRVQRSAPVPFSSTSDLIGTAPFNGAVTLPWRGAPGQKGLEARHLLGVLPETPFWLDAAAPHLQVFIGELCDQIATLMPESPNGYAAWDSLEVPIPTLSTENEASDITPSPTRIAEVVAQRSYNQEWNNGADMADQSTLDATVGAALNETQAARLPGLIVPLRGLTYGGQTPVSGLVLLWIDSDDGQLSSHWQAPLEAAAWQAGGWLSGALRSERFGRSYRELAEVCASAIDGRDAKRAGHSGAVAYYCGLIARSLGIDEPEAERIEFAGLLHDIGKVAVPDAILQKNAPLTLEELDAVRSSTITGADWLRRVEGLESVAAIVRHQAERWDGSGFPEGLNGEEIPVGARILAVALRFSAMTKPRADRAAMSVVSGAFEALVAEAGAALDPRVVEAFLNVMGRSMSV